MKKSFKPKYVSCYNEIERISMPEKGEDIGFVPKYVNVEKREPFQNSYVRRSEKAKLRTYNG